jgi:phosphatidylglycerol lysyltransferase
MTRRPDSVPSSRRAADAVSALAVAGRHCPVTAALLLALLMTAPLVDALAGSGAVRALSTGVPALAAGRWETMLTAALVVPGYAARALTTIVVLALLAPVERRFGSRRLALCLVVGQVVATGTGLGLVTLLGLGGERWAQLLAGQLATGPLPGVLAVAGLASAWWTPLWRRRVRLGLGVLLSMLVLYSGQLDDVLRWAGLVTGLLAGALVRIARRGPATPRSVVVERGPVSRRESRALVALLVAATAVGPLVAALSRSPDGPWAVVSHLFVSSRPPRGVLRAVCGPGGNAGDCRDLQDRLRLTGFGPALTSVLPVLLQLVLAEGLRRGRRAAWVGAVVLAGTLTAVGAAVVTVVLHSPSEQLSLLAARPGTLPTVSLWAPVVAPGLVLGLLLMTRSRFDVRAAPGSGRRWAVLAVGGIAAVVVAYLTAGLALTSHDAGAPGAGRLLLDLPARLLPPGYLGEVLPRTAHLHGIVRVLVGWTGMACWTVLVATAWRTVRPAAPPGDLVRARQLVRRHGDGALSFMTTWVGNRYWFTGSGQAMVAYRVIGGVALTTGDPVGPADERATAAREFTAWCTDRGWTPCWYSVTDSVAETLPTMRRVQVATETWLPLGQLAFVGRKWQDVRTALNRATREGTTTHWVHWNSAPLTLRDQLTRASEAWLADKGLPEMGFTLGGLDELTDPAVRCLVALDADGAVLGLTSWLPARREDTPVGWTLDLMRRTPGCPPGIVELLIATAALTFQDEGALFVSLSGAPLALPFGALADADALARILQAAGRAVEPVYGFRSLLAFKAKFQPQPRSLWLLYPDPTDLPRIAAAVSHAYLPHMSIRQAIRLARALARSHARPTRGPTTVGPPTGGPAIVGPTPTATRSR